MGLETIVRAYLMLFWPETGDFSKTTMLDYKIATAQFDESLAEEARKVRSYYEDVGIVQITKPADYVGDNTSAVYDFGWKKLEEKRIRRDRNITRLFIVRVEHAGKADVIAKYFPQIIFKRYMDGDKELRYVPLSQGSKALN